MDLKSEIRLERNIINKDSKGFIFISKSLTITIITQLFLYIINKSIQYKYIYISKVFVFFYILNNPITIYYSIYVPNLDIQNNNKNKLYSIAII